MPLLLLLSTIALGRAVALDLAIAFRFRLFKDIQPSKLQLVGPALAQQTAVGLKVLLNYIPASPAGLILGIPPSARRYIAVEITLL